MNDKNKNPLVTYKHLFEAELEKVDDLILSLTELDTDLITKLVKHLILSGGKRVRPVLTILSAKGLGYSGSQHIELASAVEFLHTATLLHDDVVDESDLRRGKKTANNIWGNQASILVGDFLLAKAFQLMSGTDRIEVLKSLSNASAIITEGEVKQLVAKNNLDTTLEEYLTIIEYKTATLFAASCEVGAIISGERRGDSASNCHSREGGNLPSGLPEIPDQVGDDTFQNTRQALYDYGLNLGIAFQIADDAIDYSSSASIMGKKVGDDFYEKKVTLPVLLCKEKYGDFWQEYFDNDNGTIEEAVKLMDEVNAVERSLEFADKYKQKAIDSLQEINIDNEIKQALIELVEFAVRREK